MDHAHDSPRSPGLPDEALRVLFVDDDPMVCKSLRRAASRRTDLTVIVATSCSGARGLVVQDRRYFDALLLDVLLPDGDGYELGRELRHFLPRAGLVYYSGTEDSPERAARLGALADGFVLKPGRFEQIVFSLKRAVAARRRHGRALHEPPFSVRLYPGADSHLDLCSPEGIAALESGDGEVLVNGKRAELTTHPLRLLCRVMLTPGLPVKDSEIRRLFGLPPEPKEWSNLITQTAKRLSAQIDRASFGAGKWITRRRQAGWVFTRPEGWGRGEEG